MRRQANLNSGARGFEAAEMSDSQGASGDSVALQDMGRFCSLKTARNLPGNIL